MTLDDILRPESQDAPVVTPVDQKPQPAPPSPDVTVERECELADAEPHFPRIFPGI